MKSLSVGDLIPTGTYEFHSRFARAVNFTDGRLLVGLVARELGPGPLNVVVDGLETGDLGRLTVSAGRFEVDGRLLAGPATPRYDSRWRGLGALPADTLAERLANLRTRILGAASPQSLAFLLEPGRATGAKGFQRAFETQMTLGAEALLGDDPAEGARQLRGRGPGLTPGGDDFLAGHLFGLHALRRRQPARGLPGAAPLAARIRAVHRAAVGSNPFSNTFLALARLGRPFGRLGSLLDALAHGRDLDRAADALLAVGASSGADLATGLHLTLSKGVRPWQ
jgi:hypothetical protein